MRLISSDPSCVVLQPLLPVPWNAGKIVQVSSPGHCCISAKQCTIARLPYHASLQLAALAIACCSSTQVMILWLMAFWVLGYVALPGGLELLGLEREELTARGQVRPCLQSHAPLITANPIT